MDNLAYDYQPEELEMEDESDFELIEGVKTFMAPAANSGHGTVIGRLFVDFFVYISSKNINAAVFVDDVDVYLPDGNLFRPDLTVVCNPDIVDREGAINGVPDLVVEVLSRSTMKKDIGIKKKIYERNGVKEYWIVDRWSKRIEVYHLIDGKYELDDVYKVYNEDELRNMTEEEKASVNYNVKVSIFDDLFIDIRKVFKWWFD